MTKQVSAVSDQDSERRFLKRRRAIHNKPDPKSSTVEGSGTDVTVNVPTGLAVAKDSVLTTLPETDEKVPVVSGVRLKTKKSPGKATVKRSGAEAAFRNESPTNVDVGVICSPITD